MKAIFLNKSERNISRVYEKKLIETLIEEADLDPETYSKEDVISYPENFKEVKYIFSTWGMPSLTEEEIAVCLPSLEAVFYSAGTVQAFARPFLNRGIRVFSAWAANAVPVAEYTISCILLANKGFFPLCQKMSVGDAGTARKQIQSFSGNFGEKVGIIGAGMIGKLVIELLRPFKLSVLVFDPFLSDDKAAELGVEKCSLEYIFENCSAVSNHLANNEQTKGMLNYSLFAKMRRNATFINTGRGAQVVESDLAKILSERPDITAILDVTYPEPPEEGHPFYTLPNCLLTPHIAGSSGDEVHRMSEYMLQEFLKYKNGDPVSYEVTEKMLETMA